MDEFQSILKDRETKIEELKNLINSDSDFLLFIGAGISKSAGYKDWNELVEMLTLKLTELKPSYKIDNNKFDNDPLKITQALKTEYYKISNSNDRYLKLLAQEYDNNKIEPNSLIKKIIKLPAKAYITTNYDTLIERATNIELDNHEDYTYFMNFNKQTPDWRISQFINKFRKIKQIYSVLHIHGIAKEPETIVLTSEDYTLAYEDIELENKKQWSLLRKLLWAMFLFNSTLFIGFSFEDYYLLSMLELVCKDAWGWDESTHYAIISFDSNKIKPSVVKDKIKNFKNNYGINVITYDSANGHDDLEYIISDLIKEEVIIGKVVGNKND